jgi:hypothetical protein
MPRASAAPVTPPAVDALIRQWGAYRLCHVHDAPTTVSRRLDMLDRVWRECGEQGLFLADPAIVAHHFYARRARSGRTTRTARAIAATVEDFRAWYAVQQHRGP